MLRHFRNSLWLAAALSVALSLTIGTVLAHEGRPVDDYNFVVGWLQEPSYEGARNAVSVTVTMTMEAGHESMENESMENESMEKMSGDEDEEAPGHHDEEDQDGMSGSEHENGDEDSSSMSSAMAGMSHAQGMLVEGLEGSIQVEVTYVPTGASRTFDLLAVFGEPGHYVANLVPTASGVYEFRVFGAVEGNPIDETFASRGGGGGFDDIRPSAGLQFPEELPEIREIESGVRGALQIAQEAQDSALAAQESGGNSLAVVALIVGIVGVVFGIAGVFFGLRARQAR